MATTRKQIPVRLPVKLADQVARDARFRNQSVNSYIIDAIKEKAERDEAREAGVELTVEDADGQIVMAPAVDPYLERLFADERNFDVLEWVTDEPGKGEQSFNVGARIRGGTIRIMDTILANPNCPYTTRSDFLRDAILTTAYIAARGRLNDERIAEFARRERSFARTVSIQQRINAQRQLLQEVGSLIGDMKNTEVGDFSHEAAYASYKQVARTIREHFIQEFPGWTVALLKYCRSHMTVDDQITADIEFPEALDALRKAESEATTTS